MEKNNANCICPFWHWEDGKTLKITCEGAEGVSSHSLKFSNKPKYTLYKAVYCEGEPEKCPYYKIINEKEEYR